MKSAILCLAASLLSFLSFSQLKEGITEEWNTTEDRQFDFWIGEWDVNLRTIQEDLTWKDTYKSTARIYPILDGKAILELWNEKVFGKGIKGYSLRYFNHEKGKWDLWLNWPGNNRSGSSSLEGSFRHGRGDFYSYSPVDDSTTLISRYTFCDVSPTSLRWDDSYSKDGGKTWSNNWIMEFSRNTEMPMALSTRTLALTYDEGKRCDLPEFREFEKMVGHWEGTLKIKKGEEWISTNASITTHKVLDGCAVISFLEYEMAGKTHKSFSLKTYNTFAKQYEDGRLDNDKNSTYQAYFGNKKEDTFSLVAFDLESKSIENEQFEWTFANEKIELRKSIRSSKDAVWELVWEGVLAKK